MHTIHFTKAEAALNDFLLVEDFDRAMPADERAAFAVAACHRRAGVGADGVIFFERSGEHDFVMVFHNPDGSTGSMCGNGGRAAALYAHTRGFAPRDMRFTVLDVEYRAIVDGSRVTLHFPPPRELRALDIVTPFRTTRPLHFVHTGAPHVVAILAEDTGDIESFDLSNAAFPLRWHPAFQPAGANVNVVALLPGGGARVRTFEKGVEAETMACGTGTIASALVLHHAMGLQPPLPLLTQGGHVLTVDFNATAPYEQLTLEGPARLVFEGRW